MVDVDLLSGLLAVFLYFAGVTGPLWVWIVFGFEPAVVFGLSVIALQPRLDFV